jgi:choline-sulfatase
MDSVSQAGPCTRTNQLDLDEEVAAVARQRLFDLARLHKHQQRPFCLVVSFTHPHDPFTIHESYWNRYKDDEIDMPQISQSALDAHSIRLRHVIGMNIQKISDAQIHAARRAYYGA